MNYYGVSQTEEENVVDENKETTSGDSHDTSTGGENVTINEKDSDQTRSNFEKFLKVIVGSVFMVSAVYVFLTKKVWANYKRYGLVTILVACGVTLLYFGARQIRKNNESSGTQETEASRGFMSNPMNEKSRARLLHPRRAKDPTKRNSVFQRADTQKNTGPRGIPYEQVTDRTKGFNFMENPDKFEGASRDGLGFNRRAHHQPDPQPNPLTEQMGIHTQEDMRKYMGTLRGETQPQWASQRKFPYMPMSSVKRTETKVNDFERLFGVNGQPERYSSGRGFHMQQPKDQMGGQQYLPSKKPDFETPLDTPEQMHPWMQQHVDNQEHPQKLIPSQNSNERFSIKDRPTYAEQQKIAEQFAKNRDKELAARQGGMSNEEREQLRTKKLIEPMATDVKSSKRLNREEGGQQQQPQLNFDQYGQMTHETADAEGSTTSGSFEEMFKNNSSLPGQSGSPRLLS